MKMVAQAWRYLLPSVWRRSAPPARTGSRRHYRRPRLEMLESRLAPAAHDTLATALPLTLDNSQHAQVAGTLADANQVDLYALRLQADEVLSIDLANQSLGASLRVFDSVGQQVALSLPSGQLDTVLSYGAFRVGVYYVGVSNGGSVFYNPYTSDNLGGDFSAGPYTLSLTVATFQPHDTLATAIPLPLTANQPAQVAGTLAFPDQVDLYALQLPANGVVDAAVTGPGSYLRLLDSTGRQVASAGTAALATKVTAPGTYYLGVSNSANQSYDPNVSDSGIGNDAAAAESYALALTLTPFQPHDTLGTAISLALNANQQAQAAGTLALPNQVNLYAVQLPADAIIQADVTDQGQDQPGSDLRLFNSSGQLIASQLHAQFNINTTLFAEVLDAGPYYLGVSSSGNDSHDPNTAGSGSNGKATGSFTLALTVTPFQADDTLATANQLTLTNQQATAGGDLLSPNQVDLYAVPLQAGQALQVDVTDQKTNSPGGILRVFDGTGKEVASQTTSYNVDPFTAETSLSFGAFSAGVYYVGVSSFGNNSYDPNKTGSGRGGFATGSYTLALTSLGTFPIDDTLATANQLALTNSQAQASGTLVYANQVDLYALPLQAGDFLQVIVTDQGPGQPGSDLRLFDSTGRQVAFQPTALAFTPGGPAGLTFGVAQAGEYFLGVSSSGNDSYDPNQSGNGRNGKATGSYTLALTLTTFQADDTLATANPLTLTNEQATAGGDLLSPNQVDLFAVPLQAGDALQVLVTDQGPYSPASTLRVFDSTGKEIASQTTPYNVDGFSQTGVSFGAYQAGTYFVGVSSSGNDGYDPNQSGSGSGGSATGSYSIALTLSSFPLDDTLNTANPLSFDGNQQAQAAGTLAFVNQVDLYAVQLPAGAVLLANVTDQGPGQPGSDLRLFDSTGRQVAFQPTAFAFTPGGSAGLTFGVGQAGEYFLGVSSSGDDGYDPNTAGSGSGGSATGSYTLALALAGFPSDDTLATANPLPLNGQEAQANGNLIYSNQVDLYAVPLQAGVTIKMQCGDPLRVFDSSGHEIASNLNLIHLPLFTAAGTGTYYLGVSSGNNLDYDPNVSNSGSGGFAPSAYTLTVSVYQPHDTLATALPLALNSALQASAAGDLTFVNQVDLYAIQSAGDQILTAASQDRLRVFDRIGKEISARSGSTGNEWVLFSAGVYYIGVSSSRNDSYDPNKPNSGSGGRRAGPYTLTVSVYQPHDTLATAILLTFNDAQQVQVNGTLAYPYQVAMYAVSLQAGDLVIADASGALTAPLSFFDSGTALGVFNSAAQAMPVQANSLAQGVQVTFTAPVAGVYYVGVSSANNSYDPNTIGSGSSGSFAPGYGSATGSYTLGLAFLTTAPAALAEQAAGGLPTNLSFATAQRVLDSTLVLGTAVSGATEYYRFIAPVPGTLNLAVTPADGTALVPRLALYGAKQQLLIQADGGPGSAPVQLNQDLQPGTYYLAVSAISDNPSGDLRYLLAVSFQMTSSMASATPPPTSAPTSALATGAFTRDGNLDLVVASLNPSDPFTGTVSVYLGNGDGTFKTPVTYHLGAQPDPSPSLQGIGLVPPLNTISVAVGDVNGDGNRDLLVTITADDVVWEMLGLGDGTFLPATPIGVVDWPVAVAVAVGQFTPDGNLAVVTANRNGTIDESFTAPGSVAVLVGNGDGTFQPPHFYGVGAAPVSVTVEDLNHDGRLVILTTHNAYDNLASPDPSNPPPVIFAGVSILLGNGDGTFQQAVLAASAPAGATVGSVSQGQTQGDFNHDGLLDLAVYHGDNTMSVELAEGKGQFQTVSPDSDIAIHNIPFLQDLTGDGIPDELVLNSSGALLVLNSSGALLFRQGLPGPAGTFAPPVIINPNNPARDATVFQTGSHSWAVAAADDSGNVVSLYTWGPRLNNGRAGFQRSVGFRTGNWPVRIATADLTGNGLDDLVVGNDFDNSVSIALQTSPLQFTTVLTQPVGVGPSGITFAKAPGQKGPDVVVSGQVSGDFTVLLNDATGTSPPTFSQEYRYRAGSGPFDIAVDPNTLEQTVQGPLDTVGIAAGEFTGSGNDDLVVLNRASQSFTLLPNQGRQSFGAPLPANTYATSAQPGQVAALTLPNDNRASVAILMEDLGQIWVYRNHGDGTLAAPVKVDAGNAPTGFAVATVNGQLALLIGNGYGDILTLLYDPNSGGFAPDQASLQNAPLAVGTLAGTGQQFVVVANQGLDQVALYYRIAGTDRFLGPIPVNGSDRFPLLGPGAVQTFSVLHDPNPYLAVANSLSNNVLVYHYDPVSRRFAFLQSYQVGDEPVSIKVADVNDDQIPDLLVANQGSDDVSVLIGQLTPDGWTATPYQRLSSGGSGPLAVAVTNAGSSHGPDLLVTNSDGAVDLLPGIGSGGQGSGFFHTPQPQADLGGPIVQSLVNAATGQLFVVGGDGVLSVLAGSGFTPLLAGVATLGDFGAQLVLGFEDGTVGVLSPEGTLEVQPTGFTDQPSALEALQEGSTLDVFVTERGQEVPVIVTFSLIPVVTELPTPPVVAQGTSLPGADLVLVATLLSGGLAERLPSNPTGAVPGEEVFGLFLPPTPGPAGEEVFGLFLPPLQVADGMVEEVVVDVVAPEASGSSSFRLGATEALQQRLQGQELSDRLDDLLDAFNALLDWFQALPRQPTDLLDLTRAEQTPQTPPPAAGLSRDHPARPVPNSSGEQTALVAAREPDPDGFPGIVPLETWTWQGLLGAALLATGIWFTDRERMNQASSTPWPGSSSTRIGLLDRTGGVARRSWLIPG